MTEQEKSPGYGEYPGTVESFYRDAWADPRFKRYLSILRRHLWVALATFLVVLTLGVLRAYRAVPVYEGAAKILVEREAPRITKFEDVVQSGSGWWGPEYYKTQEGLILSRVVLDVALEDPAIKEMFEDRPVGTDKPSFSSSARFTVSGLLGMPPPTPPEPWERLRSCIIAQHLNETHFILVKAASTDRTRAAMMANAVARAFVRYHLLRKLVVTRDVFSFLQDRKRKEETALAESERKLQDFREATQISSLDASDQEHPVLKRLALLNSQLTERQMQRIDLETQARVVREALQSGVRSLSSANTQLFSIPAVGEDPTISEIRGALVAAERDKAEMANVYGPEHPRMQAAASKIQLLNVQLTKSLSNTVGSIMTRLNMVEQQEQEFTRQYNEQNGLALDLAKQSLTFQHLANEVERHRRLYQVLAERMGEIELSADYGKTNVEVVEEAGVPESAVRPNKARMAFISLFWALIAGISLALLLERLDDTVRTPDDLEMRVGIPVLGFVPQISVKKQVESKTSYRALISVLEPHSSAIEAYRNIRTNLFFSSPSKQYKVLLVASGGPGDGKTTTACNIALILAQSGKRVLLMDADLRRPRIHKVFNLDQEPGLSSVLVGECALDQAVQKTVHDIEIIENLDILSAGQTPPRPTELLESDAMRKLIADVREKYDWVILDTPPVLFVSDTSILSTITDGVILVVKSAKRTWAHATRARKQIEKVNGRIIGGILNNVRVTSLGHYYSDYFYHGYAHHRSDYYSAYYSGRKEDEQKQPQKRVEV
ncbi:MAG: polysaccharide biosynthesis tyrosine autokinase [Verrucomicrobiota bacterium]